jgi:hypothetical protein
MILSGFERDKNVLFFNGRNMKQCFLQLGSMLGRFKALLDVK